MKKILAIFFTIIAIIIASGIGLGIIYGSLPQHHPQDNKQYCESVDGEWSLDQQYCILSNEPTNKELWQVIQEMVEDCEVVSIMQTHNLQVTATLKNGETIIANEPKIDDIFDIVNKFEDKCGEIIMATE